MKNISVSEFISLSPFSVVIDVRTPAEFAKGHVVGAVNMPLFTNEERAVVGTLYKKKGKEAAVERGLDFVGPRMSHFIREARRLTGGDVSKQIILYCWRGGMRSNSLAWLLTTAGFKVVVLSGGYKAYRRSFESKLKIGHWKLVVLGGPTGCGKTDVLEALRTQGEQVIDLEGAAQHRGSAFGLYGYDEEQPTSEHFANIIYSEFLKLDPSRVVWCEGESMSIGRVFMPQELYNNIQKSPFIYFTLPEDERLNHIVRDYGECPTEVLVKCFNNISKRLGYDRAKEAIELVEAGRIREAAAIAMRYYDEGYNHSIHKRVGEIIARVDMPSDNPYENAKRLIEEKLDSYN